MPSGKLSVNASKNWTYIIHSYPRRRWKDLKNARKTYPILISKQDTFSEFNGLFLSGLDKALLMLYICKQSATRGRTSNCSASCLNLLFRQ